MSGLTINRIDFTAAELNAVFNNVVDSLKFQLPPDVRVNANGEKFDDITLPEGSDIASLVNEPKDILKAVTTIGTSNFNAVFMVDSVFDTDSNSYSENKKRILIFEPDQKTRRIQSFSTASGTTQFTSFTDPFSGAVLRLPVGNRSNSFNDLSREYNDIPLAFLEYDFTSVSALTLTSNRNILNSGVGWYDNNYSTRELFEEVGFSKWGSGLGTTISLMDLDDTGFSSWFPGKGYTIGVETFARGWPQGVSPSRPSSSDGSCDRTEDISSQIGGGLTLFTIAEDFTTDSLKVYYNGQRQPVTEISATQFITTFTPVSGDSIIVDYCPDTTTA